MQSWRRVFAGWCFAEATERQQMNYAYDCKKKPEVVGFFKAQTKLAHLTTL